MPPKSKVPRSDFWQFRSRCESPYHLFEDSLQRLFSTFADGWPGLGLLLLRFLTAGLLIFDGMAQVQQPAQFGPAIPNSIGAVMGILLVAGLWTPVVATLVAIVEMSIIFSQAGHLWPAVVLAALGASLAMIGPGAWSVDARLFGRKHIQISQH